MTQTSQLSPAPIKAGRLEIRPDEHAVLADGRHLLLTARERDLLTELARAGDRILTREELHEAAWGSPLRGGDRSIDVYVSRVRRKLATALPELEFIHTHFGIGYRFQPLPNSRSHPFHTSATGA